MPKEQWLRDGLVVCTAGMIASAGAVGLLLGTSGIQAHELSRGLRVDRGDSNQRVAQPLPGQDVLPKKPTRESVAPDRVLSPANKRVVGAAPGEFTIVIEGATQGRFRGEGNRESNKDKIIGVRFEHEITDGSGLGTSDGGGGGKGKREATRLVTMTKLWGASSPQFAQAATAGESLKRVELEFTGSSGPGGGAGGAAGGDAEVFYVIVLTNARIVRLKQFSDDRRFFEDIVLSYEKMSVEHVASKSTATLDSAK